MVNSRIISNDFKYFDAKNINDALSFLAQHGDRTKIIAGGTDLLIQMKLEELKPDYLININGILALNYIHNQKEIYIGCTTRIRDLQHSDLLRIRYTALTEAAQSFSSTQIKNMGTIGGNLCNASPAGDTAPALLVFDAKIKILTSSGERVVPLEEFFIGPGKTILSSYEILTEIVLPELPSNTGSAFLKIGRVKADIAKVNVAVIVKREKDVIKSCRIALGSVAETPIRLKKAEQVIEGKRFDEKLVEKISKIVSEEIKPITDIRSTSDYRREISRTMFKNAFNLAWERANGYLKKP